MLERKQLHEYQVNAIDFANKVPKCGLFLGMGLGKTSISLTIASDFLDDMFITSVLIIAPLRVANTVWQQQAMEWAHLNHLKINICTGKSENRLKQLNDKADIYVINRENIPWLCSNFKDSWKWDMCIIDESTSFKSPRSRRFKDLKGVANMFSSVVLLSGTPSPNGLMDLWSQIYLLDKGERLGKNITAFRTRFFTQNRYQSFEYIIKEGAEKEINDLISDICITMTANDYLELPERIDIIRYIELAPALDKQYKKFEKEFVLAIQDKDNPIMAIHAGILANKLLQFCNGAIYDEDKKTHELHDEKINCLKDIVEDNPSENILVAYNFKSDLERLIRSFPEAVSISSGGEEVAQWNKGGIKMLLAHPASAGHGLNLQYGGNIVVWFGLNWSLELYQQFNARLHRQGQQNCVRIIHIVAKDKLDDRVMKALNTKNMTQNKLIEGLRYIND